MVRDTLARMLELGGHKVVAVASGREALEKMAEFAPDVAITDIIMPDTEGIELILELRRKHPKLPIVAISGGGRGHAIEYLDLAQKLGASRTLAKPFKSAALLNLVAELAPQG
jgi:CheY-like chemotaxis protein